MGQVSTEKPRKAKGRPMKLDLNETELKRVETLAGYGLTQPEICNVIGVGETTLWKYQKEFPAFNEAWLRGKQRAKAHVASKLMQKIEEGDLPAIKWYEQTRCGLSEKVRTESEITHKVETLEQYLRREKDVGTSGEVSEANADSSVALSTVVGVADSETVPSGEDAGGSK